MSGLVEAVASGDARRIRESTRGVIAAAIAAGVPARDLASLSRQLRVVLRELDELDDVPRRRRNRRGGVA